MEAVKYRKEGYFVWCGMRIADRVTLRYMMSIGLYGDTPTAPYFEDKKEFNINDVLVFNTRAEAEHMRRYVKEVYPKINFFIGLRIRHKVTMHFFPIWMRYGRYLWVYKTVQAIGDAFMKLKPEKKLVSGTQN